MKRLAKDIWISRPDRFNFELLRKWHTLDDNGELKRDSKGNIKESTSTIGWYSTFDRAWNAVTDLGMAEFINGDLNECVKFIEEASKNMKEYIDDVR
jgi:hypothetical protein